MDVWKNSGISHLFQNKRKDKPFLLLEEAFWSFFEPLPIPPYLQQAVQNRIRKMPDWEQKIHFHQGNLHEMVSKVVKELGKMERFDFIQTSNITDWISPDHCETLMQSCREALSSQGIVLARRLK